MIDNCTQIKTIHICNRSNVKNKTFNELITLGLRNPRIEYDFYFSGLEEFKLNVNNKEIVSMPIILDNFELPNNLKLNLY